LRRKSKVMADPAFVTGEKKVTSLNILSSAKLSFWYGWFGEKEVRN